jgi:hypothetical protein
LSFYQGEKKSNNRLLFLQNLGRIQAGKGSGAK